MQHSFGLQPAANIDRSVFNRDSVLKTAFDCDKLIPIFWDEMLPGDTFHLSEHLFGRLTTPVKPIMDNLYLETFYFVVPHRLLWDKWKTLHGEQKTPDTETDILTPIILHGGNPFPAEELADFFGLPLGVAVDNVNVFHFRAYNKIWNEWFRDQNLQEPVIEKTDDGPDQAGYYSILKRNKRPDYFTSCLPWAQKGEPVRLPIGSSAPVRGDGNQMRFTQDGIMEPNPTYFGFTRLNPGPGLGAALEVGGQHTLPSGNLDTNTAGTAGNAFGLGYTDSGLVADLSAATASTINELRTAFQIQKLLERDARGGTRYVEMIKSHFGVTSPDYRLQRSEYLGGGHYNININPVQQTSNSTADHTPQGNLSAYGVMSGSKGGFSYSATEHMVVIGLACIRADLTYQQGLDRMWTRRRRFDYYYPALANLGEQAVFNKEIFFSGPDVEGPQDGPLDEYVFGYQERYAEYRYKRSSITGKMRSTHATPLDVWHLSEEFDDCPNLNSTFIEQNTPLERCLAIGGEPHLMLDGFFELKAVRPMPTYSVPGLTDHL